MDKKRKFLAEKTMALLNRELKKDANCTGSIMLYQLKTPKELSKFRKK